MIDGPIPEQVFLEVSRALNTMWGYDRTLDAEHFERVVADGAKTPNLRKAVTVAYRAGQAATMDLCAPGTPGNTPDGLAAPATVPASSEMQAQLALRAGRDGLPSRSPRRSPTRNSSNANGMSIA